MSLTDYNDSEILQPAPVENTGVVNDAVESIPMEEQVFDLGEHFHPTSINIPQDNVESYTNWKLRHMFPQEHASVTQAYLNNLKDWGLPENMLAITPEERDLLFRAIISQNEEEDNIL